MARSHQLRLAAVALWAMCIVGAGAGLTGQRSPAAPAGAPADAISALQSADGAAVLPGRASGELRAANQPAPLRTLLVVAVLAGLVGLAARGSRRSIPTGQGRRPMLARRHAICLRAPPPPRPA